LRCACALRGQSAPRRLHAAPPPQRAPAGAAAVQRLRLRCVADGDATAEAQPAADVAAPVVAPVTFASLGVRLPRTSALRS